MTAPNEKPRPTGTNGGSGADSRTCKPRHSTPKAAPVELILSALAKYRQTAPGRWLGSCPGPLHKRGDRNMSLSIGETAEGAALVHCFAGCETADILRALGLEMSDLFPPKLGEPGYHGGRPKVPPIPWRDVWDAIGTDLTACSIAFTDLARGKTFSPEDAAFIARKAADLADQIGRVRHGR